MKNKTLDAKIRQMINRRKPIKCSYKTLQAFIKEEQDYIGLRIDGVYYHYSPKSKTQQDKIRYYTNFKYE